MALLRWDEEEEKKEEDGFAQPTSVAPIESVQSSWQPTQQGQATDENGNVQQPQNENYLMSEEKAQADAQQRAQKAAEAQRRAEMARQAAIARQNEAIDRQNQANAQAQAQEQKEYKPKNAGEAAGDFFQGLAKGIWRGGAGALGSGASLVSSLISGDADNDVTNATKKWQKSADDWGSKVHADGFGDFIGSLPGSVVSGIVDPANYMVRGVRNTPEMLAASIAAGSSDPNLRKTGIEMQKELQARQFGDDVAKNGDAAMLMEGVAKPGAMILNVVTAGQGSAAIQVSKPVWQRIAASAAKEGIINIGAGVPISVLEQAARGQEITWDSVGKDALIQGAVGATVGGASQGYAISKNRGGIRENASQLEGELTPVERAVEDIDQRPVDDGNITFEQPATEAPVADGVVTPVTPDAPQYTPIADNLTPIVDDGVATPQPLTEAPDQFNGQTPPDWDEVTAREVAAVREQPAPESAPAAPVADGTAQSPTLARPVDNMPVIRGEEVRALQEARAGKSQAEEAVINQRLQEIDQNTPSVYRSEDPERYGIGQAELGNGLYTGSKETAGRRADGTINEEGLYEYKVNPEARVLDSSSDEFRSFDSQASTHPSLKEPGISETEWRNRKTAILGQLVRDAGYDGVKRGTNQFVGMSERALTPVTEGAPVYRSEPDAPAIYDSPVKWEKPERKPGEEWLDSLAEIQSRFRREAVEAAPELHRYDAPEGTPNVEGLDKYSANRGTGGWGSGVYFNIKKQGDRENGKSRHTTVKNTLEDPFVIKSSEQSYEVNNFGKLLMRAVHGEDIDEFSLWQQANKAKIPYDENIARQAIEYTKQQVNGRSIGVGDKSLANVDQPMNHYMRAFGHDGILNNGVDDSTAGSVVFRGTKAYAEATRQLEEARAPKTEGAPVYRSEPDAPAVKREFKTEQGHPISGMPTEVIKTDGGYIRILPNSPYAPDNLTSIVKVMVDEKSRRQGIGSDLLKEAMKKYGRISAFAENEASQRMNYKLGMRPVDKPNATLDEVLALGREQGGGVTMVTPATAPKVDMPNDALSDARAPKESEIANNIHIRELDNSLESIRQRRAQMIADGRSENYHGVKQLDKAADAIIREQEKIAKGLRQGDEVLADNNSQSEWERQRNNAMSNHQLVASQLEAGIPVRMGRRTVGTSFAKAYRQNVKALENAQPNKTYEIDPKTGKTTEHEASELLAAFSRSIGEDLPPIIIGNTPKSGAGRRLDTNTAGANATYSSSFSRLDYKEKRSVYHETVHHIDHFIEDYKGKNPKILELQQLRKEITPEEVRKYKKVDSSADNVYEYVAHAMDVLLDGRLKKGELGAGVLKYVKAFFTEVKEALSSAHVYGRQGIDTVKYIKELDRAIHEIDVSKMPKQKPLSPEDLKPTTSNLPTSMTPVKAPTVTKPKKTITPEQKSINDFAKRVFSNTDLHKDFQRRLARALGLEKDTESSVAELLENTSVKVSPRDKNIIQKKFDELESITTEYNKLMKQQRKGYQKGKISGLDEAASKRANQLIDTYGRIERDLNGYVRKIQGRRSIGNRVANIAENITGARNASILTSVGGVSRNISQELGANILETVLHPVRMSRGVVKMPAEIARAYKRTAKEFTVKPKTVSEVFPYAIGNTYRFIMSPVTGIANVRKGVARDALAESLLRAQGETPTRAEIKKFAGAMGADSEVVANNLMGILNGMTSHGKGLEVMKSYQEFIKTGSPAAKANFLANTEHASNLAAKMTQMATESDNPRIRIGVALMNTVFPFVNTATNLAKTAATYNLSPVSRSINDEVLAAVRSNPQNVMAILKNKAVTYGVLGGVYALYEADVIGYNDGEEIDKPKGIYIDMGNGTFHAVRATPIELPIAAVITAAEIAKHAAEGDMRPANYYAGIIGNSLPYVDSTTNLAAAAGSATNAYLGGDGTSGTDDNGYAAKAYGVNLAKSYVPWANNGVIPAINSQNGKSTNAKSVYDKDIPTWFNNSVRSSFDPAFRESLPDSRDNAGRVRTVDQQGLWSGIKKTINDKNTATYNEAINNLVTFARQNGLGRGTKDMFNTYDTGKNNNFKSVQDTITFLDVEDGGKPDNAKKLEQNDKLGELAAQIRDGFWGDTGAELLTLNGQNLYSDVSVPNADGTKNSRLPLNMQSIKNAIAATDLPKEQRDRMYEISQANQALYAEVESGAMTYAQYKQVKAASEQEYVDILSNSDSYKKLGALMDNLDKEGFFEIGGVGSTKSGQTYLWNSLNALLGSKGATPAAQYPKSSGFGSGGGGGGGSRATIKPGDRNNKGIQWTPVGKREMAMAKTGKYTPVEIKVKLGNQIKKNRTQNYSDRSF